MENISIVTSEEMLFINAAGFVSNLSNGGEDIEPLNA